MRITLVLVLVLFVALPASAQPQAWVLHRYIGSTPWQSLFVVNLATGRSDTRFDLTGVTIGGGDVTPDGQFYLLATSFGVVRFSTATRSIVGLFGPAMNAGGVRVSPSGRWVYVLADTPRRIVTLDANTGAVVSERSDPPFQPVFSPDGAMRYEVIQDFALSRTVITAYPDAPDAPPLWQKTLMAIVGGFAASDQEFIYSEAAATVVLAAATGQERGRVALRAGFTAIHSRTLYVTTTAPPSAPVTQVMRIDLDTLASTVLREFPALIATFPNGPTGLRVSSDGRVVYLLHHYSVLGITVSRTSYYAIDTATGELVATGVLNSQYTDDFDVEPGAACIFRKPPIAGSVVPPQGGLVDLPVVADGPCLPWTVLPNDVAAAVNAGPHTGSATLFMIVAPILSSTSRAVALPVPGGGTTVTQTGALPAAPRLTGNINGGRLTLSWTPTFGAGQSLFTVYGGLCGGALVPVALPLSGSARTWSIDGLPAGSYQVRIAASNGDGIGAMSNPFEFSVGVTELPDAPVSLQVIVADDDVQLRWQQAPTGPAPAAYDIEASPAGAGTFVAVRRVSSPELAATNVPSGSWDVRVRAVTDGGTSAPSNTVRIATAPCTAAPSAPTSLSSVGATVNHRTAHLEWNAPATSSADEYVIEAGLASAATAVRIVSPGSGRVFETRVPPGVYFARVRARNACGESAPSNEVIVFIP